MPGDKISVSTLKKNVTAPHTPCHWFCNHQIHREGEDETDEEVETEDFELKAADEKNDGNIRRLGSPLIKGSPDASVVEKGDGTTLPSLMRVSKKDAARRHLAEVAAEGIEKARLSDPDIDAKDSDIRLLEVFFLSFATRLKIAVTCN